MSVTSRDVGAPPQPEGEGALRGTANSARLAARVLATLPREEKDRGLGAWADAIEGGDAEILASNALDLETASAEGASRAVLDRLRLDGMRIREMAEQIRHVASLEDPVGSVIDARMLDNGLRLEKVTVPIGVIGVIYEGRPNVTVDAASLAVKSGNAVLLRGSRTAERSNACLVRILREGWRDAHLPFEAVQAVPPTRQASEAMMRARGMIDLLIPRGGADLIQTVVRESQVPVIETGVGNCHVYVDAHADLEKALRILINAKVQRPGVCNAAETLLVHRDVADAFVPQALSALADHGVEVFGDPEIRRRSPAGMDVQPATDADFLTEFLDLKIAAKVVDTLEEALEHIETFGSRHTDAIVSEDLQAVRRFVAAVDSAAVMVNASTRFTDGGEFGMGAEIGISTQKLHARGPMALPELTTYKWVVWGSGQVRA
ncbi:MAG TPA: glutamate-5-semialdehyde dehydrogenase [Actinomycetota bacterium]|nr:glutamate-5-semialdehyde dehydrogenase [Actinomycetota bacterium]